ncbi:MAG: glycosyltransferase family 39 protein [Chloroflexota bacterium]
MIEFVNAVRIGLSSQSASLKKNVLPNLTIARLIVIALMMLAAGLFLYNIRTEGDANAYYTAAVKSMLQSWHNFFFIAAEPGGAVSVDKPPLGLWIEAVFGFIFGVSGFTLSIPNLIAGVIEIPILYSLVKRYTGDLPGVIAALVLVLTPIFVATHRHNTLDGMLTLTLLLAAWAFMQAVDMGQLRWLLLGGFILGIGFNIKMAQVLLPVPALYTFYFLCSREGWFRKILNLLLTTALCIAVSLSWAIIVDRTPADQRPFVGSTNTNSVMELMLDHNAAKRISTLGLARVPVLQNSKTPEQNLSPIPRFNVPVITYQQETGKAGALRFFIPPLSRQMSWLLPMALLGTLLAVFDARVKIPVESDIHKALILWGGWFLTCLVFFSIISGIFHSYYIIVGVPAFCAMVAIGFTRLWNWGKDRSWAGVILILAAAGTLAFQGYVIQQFKDRTYLVYAAGVLLVIGSLLMIFRRRTAYLTILAAMLLVPAYWTLMTAITNANQTFPHAYEGGTQSLVTTFVENDPNLSANERILSYLQSNTQDVKYLVAVPSALQGMPLVLTSERPVFYLGGFSGLDQIIDAQGLKALVAKGDLRYILYAQFFRRPGGAGRGDPEILAWLNDSCYVVPAFDKVIIYTRRPRMPVNLADQLQTDKSTVSRPRNDYLTLYLCP